MLDPAPDFSDLLESVKEGYAQPPARAQRVARWLVERPEDVALLSTRQQARSLGLAPATLTRFAKHFGFAGYEALRGLSQQRLRAHAASFAPEARRMRWRGARLPALPRAARLLARGRHLYVLGNRSSFPIAYPFYYVPAFGGAQAPAAMQRSDRGLRSLYAYVDTDRGRRPAVRGREETDRE